KPLDQDLDQVSSASLYLSTAPVVVSPAKSAPGKPASATYIAPLPSNVIPRGFFKFHITGLTSHDGPAAKALPVARNSEPASARAPAMSTCLDRCIRVPLLA